MSDVFNPESPAITAETLVGEGKKFKTVDDLAKSKAESDTYIARLEAQTAELRADLDKRLNAEAQLEALKEELKTRAPATQTREVTPPALTEDAITALVAKTITDSEVRKTQSQNQIEANKQMVKHFGSFEKAKEAMDAKMDELGLDVQALKSVAAKSPTAFMQLIVGDKQAIQNPGGSYVKSTERPIVTSPTREGTKEFYEELRTKNPRLYWSPSTQQRIFDAVKNGTYST